MHINRRQFVASVAAPLAGAAVPPQKSNVATTPPASVVPPANPALFPPLAPAAPLQIRAFNANGSPLPENLLSSLLLLNRTGTPFELLPQPKGAGVLSIRLPSEYFEMTMVVPVRGFGQVYLYADNTGALYPPDQSAGREIIFNYEAARSRAAFVRRYVEAARSEGVTFSPATLGRLSKGEAALARATSAPGITERVAFANNSLAETMWAGEIAALDRARYRIGKQAPREGFLFGANAFGYARSEAYDRLFNAVMNFCTVPFYRHWVEPQQGHLDYSRVEAILRGMKNSGILVKGHPLVWFHRTGTPDFLKSMSWEELKRSCRDYILTSVGVFRSRIHAWDVINEAHDWANDLHLSDEQLMEMTRLAAESVHVADPTGFRVVNNCCTWGEYVARDRTYSGPLGRPSRTPFQYLQSLGDARVPYDAIGLQYYYPARDMLEIERNIEQFFALGKPVYITELGVSSSSEPVERNGKNQMPTPNVWHGQKWTPEIQADWVEQFYTICYSKPQIRNLTWWDFSDPAFMPHGGLVDKTFRPKLAYEQLAKLRAQWRGPNYERLKTLRVTWKI